MTDSPVCERCGIEVEVDYDPLVLDPYAPTLCVDCLEADHDDQ
jgi:hypothetical protein